MDANTFNRRDALRLFGATLGIAAVGSAAPGLVSPASADSATAPLALALDKLSYAPGELMTLTVTEDIPSRHTRINDTAGHLWTKVYDNGRLQLWQATATTSGEAFLVCEMYPRDSYGRGSNESWSASTGYLVAVDPLTPEPTPPTTTGTIIGMSSPADVWDERFAEVGGVGLGARRIFADLRAGADDQMNLVEQAHDAGLMPVISYKVGGDPEGAAAGSFNAVAEQAAERLASFGLLTTVTYWHEPHGDMTPEVFVEGNKQLLPIFQRDQLKVGPLLNGWLLDRQHSTFTSYCPDELFELWDWFGIDTYESGTMEFPGLVKPGHRIPALAAYVESRGFDLPLGIGEYNGYSAESIAAAGDAILSEPKVWFGCMWNSTTGKGYTLTDERLDAFKQTLADPRTLQVA